MYFVSENSYCITKLKEKILGRKNCNEGAKNQSRLNWKRKKQPDSVLDGRVRTLSMISGVVIAEVVGSSP